MKFKYIIPVLAAVAAVSCQKADQEFDSNLDPNAVRIEATVGGVFTRSNPLEGSASSVFKTNDVVAVAADAQAAVNYTYDGAKWSAEASKYLRWDTPTMTFKAWYPHTASMTDFVLPVDQSTTAGIESADYMTYSGDHTIDGTNPISLTLQRKTARVILKIAAFGDEYAENERTVSNVKIYSGAGQYRNGVASTDIMPVTCYANSTNDTFTALVIPTVARPIDFLDLYDGKGNRLFAKGIPAMEAGKSYTYNLRVGKDEVAITGITVNDWATGEVIPDGDAEVIKPKIGFYYFEDGTYGSDLSAGNPIGIIFYVNPDGKTGKIVGLDEPEANWNNGTNAACQLTWGPISITTAATSDISGLANMATIKALDDTFTAYPAFAWAHSKNPADTDYSTATKGVWYLPATKELRQLYAAMSGLKWVASGAATGEINDWGNINDMPNYSTYGDTRTAFNTLFNTAGKTTINLSGFYWSSTEINGNFSRYVNFGNSATGYGGKEASNGSVRVVSAF